MFFWLMLSMTTILVAFHVNATNEKIFVGQRCKRWCLRQSEISAQITVNPTSATKLAGNSGPTCLPAKAPTNFQRLTRD
jgi:hypothetical protein